MAKRNRISNRKRLGPNCRRRNTTPKLSPFQRELRRDRLANQPPNLCKITRDCPASARGLMEFLSRNKSQNEMPKEQLATVESNAKALEPPPQADAKKRKHSKKEQTGVVPKTHKKVVTFDVARPQESDKPHRELGDDESFKPQIQAKQRIVEEKTDFIRFGERVEAPPEFDVLPISCPALMPKHRMGVAKRMMLHRDQFKAAFQPRR